MCNRVYYLCRHHSYVKECVAKQEPEASCCFGGGGGCRGIDANVTRPEYCPDCKAKQAATRAAKTHGWYGHKSSSSHGANRLNNKSSCDSIIEADLMKGVAAMPGMVTYDTRRRGPSPVQPAYYPQGRRTREAPQRQPVVRNMPSIHEASHRPQIQRGYVAAQPMSATMVYPTPPSFRHDSQRRHQQPQMKSVQRHEPPSFTRHMQQHTTAQRAQPETATPARHKSRHARPQRAQGLPQPVRKPTRRDSNGVSDFGSDDEDKDEDDRQNPWTPSPSRESFHPHR
ncbi:hypothetical protein PG999_013495 [Apiospora kogelbergensis]|uniref:Uncharacterized protein n=1 Tax=Apiospora kogelbergensis TaxID=1337665 RepID=A0AAW0Q698_9PEZI